MRALAVLAASFAVIAAGACGSDESDPPKRGAVRAQPPGITAEQYGGFELRATTRGELESRIGRPRVVLTQHASTCLRYAALDANGAPVREFEYQFCFRRDRLHSASTVPRT